MNFTEKLARLTSDSGSKKRVSIAAGIPVSAISNYISKRQMPRGDKALSLSRALSVSLEWLVDDKQDWPPPTPAAGARLEDVPHQAFVREYARRFRLIVLDAIEALDAVEREDWSWLLATAKKLKPKSKLPVELKSALSKAVNSVELAVFATRKFNLNLISDDLHAQLPGNDQPIESLTVDAVDHRFTQLTKIPAFVETLAWMKANVDVSQSPRLQLPPGLSEAFDRIISNLHEEDRRLPKK